MRPALLLPLGRRSRRERGRPRRRRGGRAGDVLEDALRGGGRAEAPPDGSGHLGGRGGERGRGPGPAEGLLLPALRDARVRRGGRLPGLRPAGGGGAALPGEAEGGCPRAPLALRLVRRGGPAQGRRLPRARALRPRGDGLGRPRPRAGHGAAALSAAAPRLRRQPAGRGVPGGLDAGPLEAVPAARPDVGRAAARDEDGDRPDGCPRPPHGGGRRALAGAPPGGLDGDAEGRGVRAPREAEVLPPRPGPPRGDVGPQAADRPRAVGPPEGRLRRALRRDARPRCPRREPGPRRGGARGGDWRAPRPDAAPDDPPRPGQEDLLEVLEGRGPRRPARVRAGVPGRADGAEAPAGGGRRQEPGLRVGQRPAQYGRPPGRAPLGRTEGGRRRGRGRALEAPRRPDEAPLARRPDREPRKRASRRERDVPGGCGPAPPEPEPGPLALLRVPQGAGAPLAGRRLPVLALPRDARARGRAGRRLRPLAPRRGRADAPPEGALGPGAGRRARATGAALQGRNDRGGEHARRDADAGDGRRHRRPRRDPPPERPAFAGQLLAAGRAGGPARADGRRADLRRRARARSERLRRAAPPPRGVGHAAAVQPAKRADGRAARPRGGPDAAPFARAGRGRRRRSARGHAREGVPRGGAELALRRGRAGPEGAVRPFRVPGRGLLARGRPRRIRLFGLPRPLARGRRGGGGGGARRPARLGDA